MEVVAPPKEQSVLDIALKTGTDKVQGVPNFKAGKIKYPEKVNPKCQIFGHFYHTMYQKWIGHLSLPDVAPFQFVEIGHSNGNGLEAFAKFMPRAELHSLEYDCELFERKAKHPERAHKYRCRRSSR